MAKFSNKIKKIIFSVHFVAKIFFSKHPVLPCTIPHEPLNKMLSFLIKLRSLFPEKFPVKG